MSIQNRRPMAKTLSLMSSAPAPSLELFQPLSTGRMPGGQQTLISGDLLLLCANYFFDNLHHTQPFLERETVNIALHYPHPRPLGARCLLSALCAYVLLHARTRLPAARLFEPMDGDATIEHGRKMLDEVVHIRVSVARSMVHAIRHEDVAWSVITPMLVAGAYSSQGLYRQAWEVLREATTSTFAHGMYRIPASGPTVRHLLMLFVYERTYALRVLQLERSMACLPLTAQWPLISSEWKADADDDMLITTALLFSRVEKQITQGSGTTDVQLQWRSLEPDTCLNLQWRMHGDVSLVRCHQQWLRAATCRLGDACWQQSDRCLDWLAASLAVIRDTVDIVASCDDTSTIEVEQLCDIADFGLDYLPVLECANAEHGGNTAFNSIEQLTNMVCALSARHICNSPYLGERVHRIKTQKDSIRVTTQALGDYRASHVALNDAIQVSCSGDMHEHLHSSEGTSQTGQVLGSALPQQTKTQTEKRA